MKQQERISYLLDRVHLCQATEADADELLQFVGDGQHPDAITLLNQYYTSQSLPIAPSSYDPAWLDVLNTVLFIDKESPKGQLITHRVHFIKTVWFRYAAAIILMLGAGAYFWFSNKKTDLVTINGNKHLHTDIAPGGNKAVLTLSDGTIITLDSAANGAIAQQGNAEIVKLANGQISYNLNGVAEGEVMMNTMRTPRGGQYQLMLPDGTKVWLNAASSITYPAVFVGKERNVKITGEAYFEIAKNKAKPFLVNVDGKSSIEVLGTHFNVNSYGDDATIKTTLLEGSIKVAVLSNAVGQKTAQQQNMVVLKLGQQALIAQYNLHSGSIAVVDHAEIDQVMAWKNGFFSLQDADLKTVMKQLERWYDIQIKYEGQIPKATFKGKMDRGVNLSDVLKFLSDSDIDVKLEGKTLVVIGQ